jgi:glycosyltransferase involved in cell wall biosynthesis
MISAEPHRISRIRLLFYWSTMGPYHFARMEAVAKAGEVDLLVVEGTSLDDHGWERRERPRSFELRTLAHELSSPAVLRWAKSGLRRAISEFRPDVIVTSGYAEPASRRVALQAKRRGTRVLFWSESTAFDKPRFPWKEWMKGYVVRQYDGALVAGTPHKRYAVQLGLSESQVEIVGGVVDNAFFSRGAPVVRASAHELRTTLELPEEYFLYVGRFLPQKNLRRLLRAYGAYRRGSARAQALDLVLVGGGPEEAAMRRVVTSEEIPGVYFLGVRQIDELPTFYGLASWFVLPSLSEPWGLVVNEAMASGLPVLLSNRCGCAEDLVQDGVNGLIFSPDSEEAIAEALWQAAELASEAREGMGHASQQRIEQFSPERYGSRVGAFVRRLLGR